MTEYTKEDLNKAVEATFLLCKKIDKKADKPLKKLDEILYGDDSKRYLHHYPRDLTIKLTSNCNLRCKHCFFYGKPESYCVEGDLPPEVFYQNICKLVDETYITQCTLTGGEIFSSPIIKPVIEYLKSKNIAVSLISNATLITNGIADWLSNIFNLRYDHIQISLDGATSEVNDKIRGLGSFERTTKAIKLLTEKGVNVQVGFTVNSQNVTQIAEMYNLCKNLNVERLNIGRFLLSDESQGYLVPNSDDVFINLAKLYEIYDETTKLQIRCVRTPHFLNYEVGRKLMDEKLIEKPVGPEYLHCAPHHELFALFPNGDVSLCYACDRKDCIVGNITEKPFEEIWSNRFNFAIFGERKAENNACKKCKYLPICCCGCLYESYKKHGTIDSRAFDCKYFEEVKDI